MKNIFVALLFHLFLLSIEAQDLQRLAIPSQHISIPAGSGRRNADPVTSFCVDFNRYSRFDGRDDYSHVTLDDECVKIGSNPSITLQEALDQGKIEMKVNHYDNIAFINQTNQPIEIDVSKNIVLGKDRNDIKDLVIPPNIKERGSLNQHDIWTRQSLIYMGFLDKSQLGDAEAVLAAKERYINSAWKAYDRIPDPSNVVAFSDALKGNSRILQYAEAAGIVSHDQAANITTAQIIEATLIQVDLFRVAHDLPATRDWPGAYYLYKSSQNEYFLFDPQYRLLVKTKDERVLAKAYAATGERSAAIPLVGGGDGLNERQGDALAAAMEHEVGDAGGNSRLYYVDGDAVRENRAIIKAVMSDEHFNKLQRQLSEQQIIQVGDESQVISDYINRAPDGTFKNLPVVVAGDAKAVKGYVGWANHMYPVYKRGALFAQIRNYFIRSKLRGYIRFMNGKLRISKNITHPSMDVALK